MPQQSAKDFVIETLKVRAERAEEQLAMERTARQRETHEVNAKWEGTVSKTLYLSGGVGLGVGLVLGLLLSRLFRRRTIST